MLCALVFVVYNNLCLLILLLESFISDYLKGTCMPDDVLVKYFEENLTKGYSKEQIIAFLKQQGYDEQSVQDVAKFVAASKTVPHQGASGERLAFEEQGNFFSRNFMVWRASLTIIKREKSMLFFPLLAALFSLGLIVAMLFPLIISAVLDGVISPEAKLLSNTIVFIIYLGLSFIATFFNVCVVYVASHELLGKKAGFSSALSFAFSRLHLIFLWSLVSATVGMLLYLIEQFAQKLPLVGRVIVIILEKIMGLMWSLISLFVVPSLVIDGVGPFAALKKSVQVLKKTWGESFMVILA
jgi:hypothetical protein